jgi:hypothetical protein
MKTALFTVFVLIVFAVLFLLSFTPWATPEEWRATDAAGEPKPAPKSPEANAYLAGLSPLLFALSSVETGNNPTAIGPGGERSAWQFTADTWRRHTKLPFRLASEDPVHAREVAEMHLDYLSAELRTRGVDPTPEHLAAAWRYGPASSRVCAGTDYAKRVARLAASLELDFP